MARWKIVLYTSSSPGNTNTWTGIDRNAGAGAESEWRTGSTIRSPCSLITQESLERTIGPTNCSRSGLSW
jgi:hypothetical protein